MKALNEIFELSEPPRNARIEELKKQYRAKVKEAYGNYHKGKMIRTYVKDRERNQLKKAGIGASLGGAAGLVFRGRGIKTGLKRMGAGAAIGGVAGFGSPTRKKTQDRIAADVRRRALKEHSVRAYGDRARRRGQSFIINPKYNKSTYAQ